jgi:hypothetical protein
MKSNEVWNPGCGPTWNQCYLYCGGWYPPSCFQFAGDAGAVNIERLEASMVVTVDSGGVPIAPGAQVTFAVRPNVTTLAGFSVPYQLDTAAWVPDPDSLGGEASELAVTGACSGGTDCRRTMNGSGTIRLVAHVNGKGFEYTQHFAMPVLTLRPLPEEFDKGDSVIFTPAWSDNTSILAGQVSGWTWAPDTGGVSTPCAAGTLPCGKRISAPGQMSVTVSRGGVSRSTKVHVGPKSEFTLSANRTTVSEGKLVRFTPKLDDDTTPAMRWRWVPAVPSADSASLCPDGATKCYRVMWATGRMWAYELSEGGDSASVDITVSAGDCLSLEA